MPKTTHRILEGDCLDLLPSFFPEKKRVDLVIASPPYEDARQYEIDFNLTGDDWVQWAADRFVACTKASKGLVAWVVAGKTKNFQWSATPALLIAELHRRGVKLRNPCIYRRDGIPGGGGPEWLKPNYEWIICSAPGRLPWADNTACGHPPKFKPGGDCSNRLPSGDRTNRPRSDKTSTRKDGNRKGYKQPALANPGNVLTANFTQEELEWHGVVIDCGAVGGGNIGDKLANENEAPFPERIPEFFIKSFCPPGGTVLDCFGGSGTSSKMAKLLGRNSISIDIRPSQSDLTRQRLKTVQ